MLFFFLFVTSFTKGLAHGGFETMNRLHQDLFAKYNPEVRPCLSNNQSIDVTTSLTVSYVMGLDIKDQVFRLIGYLTLKWKDDQLSWEPETYEGIQRIFVKEYKVWRPDIVIFNSVTDKVYVGDENVIVYINHNGTVVWEPEINLGVTCKVDISNYPFDVNVCTVVVASWNFPETAVKLMTAPVPIRLRSTTSNGQYWIDIGNYSIIKSNHHGEVYRKLLFDLKLARRPGYLIMTLLLPLTLLAVLCVVSFILSPEVAEKTPLAITILLAFTVFLNVVDKELPETSDQMAHIVKYVIMLLFLAFFCVIGNASVIAIHKRDFKAEISLDRESRDQKDQVSLDRKDQPCKLKDDVSLDREDWTSVQQKVSSKPEIASLNGRSNIVIEQTTVANQKRMSRAEKLNRCFLALNFLALALTIISYFAIVLV